MGEERQDVTLDDPPRQTTFPFPDRIFESRCLLYKYGSFHGGNLSSFLFTVHRNEIIKVIQIEREREREGGDDRKDGDRMDDIETSRSITSRSIHKFLFIFYFETILEPFYQACLLGCETGTGPEDPVTLFYTIFQRDGEMPSAQE